MLSRGCISVVTGIDISFWKAHEILSDEKNCINNNWLFLDWVEKLNHDRQTYLNTTLWFFCPFNMFCGINFTSEKRQTRSTPASVLRFFQPIVGLGTHARWGQIAERSCWGNSWSCCAWELPTKTESSYVLEKAAVHICDKMGAVNKRCQWMNSLDSNSYTCWGRWIRETL